MTELVTPTRAGWKAAALGLGFLFSSAASCDAAPSLLAAGGGVGFGCGGLGRRIVWGRAKGLRSVGGAILALLDQTFVVDVVVEFSSAADVGGGRSPYNPPSIMYHNPKRLQLRLLKIKVGIGGGIYIRSLFLEIGRELNLCKLQ